MARTLEQIEQIIDDALLASPDLVNLNSISETALYKQLRDVFAKTALTLETALDAHKIEVEKTVAENKVLRLDWYRKRALEFQYGDDLIIENEVIKYAIVDLTKRIVTRAAAVAIAGEIKIKVAKGATGSLTQLSANEMLAIQGYFDLIQGAGDRVEVISLDADVLQISGAFYYNPLLDKEEVKANLILSIQNYLANIDFNGEFRVLHCEDEIQKAVGCKDFDFAYSCKPAADLSYTLVPRAYQASSGHMELDPDFIANIENYIQFNPLVDVPN